MSRLSGASMFTEWATLVANLVNGLTTAPSIKLLLGFAIAVFAKLLGLSHSAVQALMLLMLCDYFLGAAHAWKENRLEFSRLKRGLGKFIVYGAAINITWLADEGMGTEAMGFSLRNLLCGYLSANEALSALTHLAEFGFPFPVWLKERLRHYRDSIGAMPPRRRDNQSKEDENEESETRNT